MAELEERTPVTDEEKNKDDPFRLVYVLIVVLVICGGNGLGIVSAALIWKLSGAVVPAIIVAVSVTLLAFICGMLIIVLHNRKKQ